MLIKPGSTLYYQGSRVERIYTGGVLQYQRVPPEPVDVYVIWGEDNAAGGAALANLPSYLSGPRPDAYLYTGSGFSPLEAKVASNRPAAGSDWGPEMQLSRLATKGGKKVYFIKYAVPAVPLVPTTGDTWNPNVSGGRFAAAKSELQAALAALSADNRLPTVRGFVWGHGRRDAVLGSTQADYTARQTELFNAVRTAVGNPNLPILDALVRDEGVTVTAVNAAKAAVKSSLTGVRTMKTNAFEDVGDNVRYNAAAQLAFGRHAFEYLVGGVLTRPASLPNPLVAFDMSRQDNWTLGSLMSAAQINDISGNGGNFVSGITSNQPALIEGPLGEGFGVLRTDAGKFMAGPTNPLVANQPYTICAVISNFQNPTDSSIRSILSASNSSGLAVGLVYQPGEDAVTLRQNGTLFLKSSVATPPGATQIIIGVYGAGSGNFMRINGVETATSTSTPSHAAGGSMGLNNFNGFRGLRADFPYLELDGWALSVAQCQLLEGFLAHRFGLTALLPASHPYRNAPPT